MISVLVAAALIPAPIVPVMALVPDKVSVDDPLRSNVPVPVISPA